MIIRLRVIGRLIMQTLIASLLVFGSLYAQNEEKALIDKASDHMKKGMFQDVINTCTEAIRINPDSQEAYLIRGIAYKMQGDLEKSFSDLDKSIEIKPVGSAYLFRGKAYFEKKEFDKAISDFDNSIKMSPQEAEGYLGRAMAYRSKGDLKKSDSDLAKSIKMFDANIKSEPKNCRFYMRRSLAYGISGKPGNAISGLTKAIELCPNDPIIYLSRANMYLARGDCEKSRRDMLKAESLGSKASPKFLEDLEKACGKK